jgi:membrane associated rhomboid family serine protease
MFDRITPLNRTIILVNVAIFGLQLLFGPLLQYYFALWPPEARQYGGPPFQIWQLLTYGFMHGSPLHILFNMFALFMFGSEIERLLGPRRYLIYYLACVVGAALMHLIVVRVSGLAPAPVVGASGGVFGILLAFGMAFPQRRLIVLPIPIPMPAWLLVTLYALAELYMGITQTNQGVAHFAHLGGMATGFVLLRYWRTRRLR